MLNRLGLRILRTSLTLVWALPSAAQILDTGLLGTDADLAGAAVAGATVLIENPSTGQVRTVTTATDGKYEVRYLVPGVYSVEAQAAGFGTVRTNRITVQINQQVRADFALQIGEVQQTVEINSSVPLCKPRMRHWAK